MGSNENHVYIQWLSNLFFPWECLCKYIVCEIGICIELHFRFEFDTVRRLGFVTVQTFGYACLGLSQIWFFWCYRRQNVFLDFSVFKSEYSRHAYPCPAILLQRDLAHAVTCPKPLNALKYWRNRNNNETWLCSISVVFNRWSLQPQVCTTGASSQDCLQSPLSSNVMRFSFRIIQFGVLNSRLLCINRETYRIRKRFRLNKDSLPRCIFK